VVQVQTVQTGGYVPSGSQIPYDDSIPQITEGGPLFDLDFTPKYANSKLLVEVSVYGTANSTPRRMIVALFRDAGADAIGCASRNETNTNAGGVIAFNHEAPANSTDLTNFSVRFGLSAGAAAAYEVNGAAGSRVFGGAASTSMTITEIAQ
jgi:hypothetical protein